MLTPLRVTWRELSVEIPVELILCLVLRLALLFNGS